MQTEKIGPKLFNYTEWFNKHENYIVYNLHSTAHVENVELQMVELQKAE